MSASVYSNEPRDRASWSNSLSFGHATVTGTLYYTSAITMTAPDNGEGCISVGVKYKM